MPFGTNEWARKAFVAARKRDESLWEEPSGYARVFQLGWEACVDVLGAEEHKILATGIARCIKDGMLEQADIARLESSLGGLAAQVRRLLEEGNDASAK